jgi:sulfocyanin
MVRLLARAATAAFLFAGALAGTPAAAQGSGGADSTGSKYLKWDAKTRTVTFELIAGAEGAKSPFNFNGYIDGEANLVVPAGATVVMNFYQADGTPHSAEIIKDADPMPNMGGSDAAIPRAYTNKVVEGLPQEARDVMRFTAPEEGSFRIFCGVPGHGLSGMWIRFTVDPKAEEPRFETKPAST